MLPEVLQLALFLAENCQTMLHEILHPNGFASSDRYFGFFPRHRRPRDYPAALKPIHARHHKGGLALAPNLSSLPAYVWEEETHPFFKVEEVGRLGLDWRRARDRR